MLIVIINWFIYIYIIYINIERIKNKKEVG